MIITAWQIRIALSFLATKNNSKKAYAFDFLIYRDTFHIWSICFWLKEALAHIIIPKKLSLSPQANPNEEILLS